jgi:citronellol/citronellal dehydrogenase
MLAALVAAVPDQVPLRQRGMVCGWLGVAQTIGVVAGSALAALIGGLTGGYLGCAVFVLLTAVPYLVLRRDSALDPARRPAFDLRAFLRGFWIDPRRWPDFGWAWLTRFLMNLGNALPLVVDVRDEVQVKDAIEQTVATFGRLDIVVNNASAVQRTSVVDTDMRRFDLMHQVNTRGTLMVSKYAIPHLEKAKNPHILMNSPPLDFREKWFAGSTAYSIAKYGMSLVVLGLAGELRAKGIAVNALWPRATIATAAIKNLLGGERVMRMSRTPAIMADAAYLVFQKPSRSFTGNFLIDDTFLAAEGITDFEQYRADPSEPLARTFFVPDEPAPPPGVSVTVERWE